MVGIFETAAKWMLDIINYAIAVIVIMIIFEVVALFKKEGSSQPGALGGKILEGAGKGWGGIKKGFGWLGRRRKKAEEWQLREYADLKALKNRIENSNSLTEDDEFRKAVNKKVSQVKRDESKAYRRLHDLEKNVEKAKISEDKKETVESIMKDIDRNTSNLVLKIRTFENVLNKKVTEKYTLDQKKTNLIKHLDEAIKFDEGIIAKYEELKKLFGA